MSKLNERTRTRFDAVLEETCRKLPHGGDHDVRAFVARRMMQAAEGKHVTQGELGIIARRALADHAEKQH